MTPNEKLVEDVAIAMRHRRFNFDNFPSDRTVMQTPEDVWRVSSQKVKERCLADASAAIATIHNRLMEPSEEMEKAGFSQLVRSDNRPTGRMFQAMLKEGPTAPQTRPLTEGESAVLKEALFDSTAPDQEKSS